MSEHERLRKATTERDIARMRLKKARGALYRIIKLVPNKAELDAIYGHPNTDDAIRIIDCIMRLKAIAKSGCGTPKKRKKAGLPGQIDLEDWLNAR